MHLKRVLVAAGLVPIFYLYVMYLPPQYFLYLLIFLSTIGLAEFYGLSGVKGPLKYICILWGVIFLSSFLTRPIRFSNVILLSFLTVMTVRLFSRRDAGGSLAETGAAMLGLLYMPGLLSFQLDIAKTGPEWIILLYASVWVADSAALYVGKGIGRRKLYKEMSPNKTVEGAVGSVFGGVLGAVLVRVALLPAMPLNYAVLLGAVIGTVTIVGDLVESMFKRDAGVKDSSKILPGHGGILDKLDGVTFAGPVFYWLCAGLGLIN